MIPLKQLRATAEAFLAAINAFDTKTALGLFTLDAVVDDPSTGHQYIAQAGVRDYLERYFIGYRTATCFLSMKRIGDKQARVRVDFTGTFGHEIGLLALTINDDGLIVRIDAGLERSPNRTTAT